MNQFFQKLLAGVLRPALHAMGRRRIRPDSGDFQVPGLQHPVEIRRDAQGVPYIYAQNQADLYYAQGSVHAQDRLWQMELNRRIAKGTLSEVFGKAALDTDRMARTFGFARSARADEALLSPDLRAYLLAYCAGVNAALAQMGKRLPIEFLLTGHQPSPWELQDVLAFSRLTTFQLSYGWGHELTRTRLYKALGPELAQELDLRYRSTHPITVPEGVSFNVRDAEGLLSAIRGPYLRPALGSNAWAVSGERTDTGKPYLCSDPHLAMSQPSIWYQVYLEAPDCRIQGVSIPGIPLVLIGHNAHIGWGITLSFSDIQDVFIEEFESPGAARYRFGEGWREAQVVEERIPIKGQAEPFIERVRITHHGPVISDVLDLPADVGAKQLSLASPAFQPGKIMEGWYGLDMAQSWDDFVDATRHIEAPGLNIVYADVTGNIGYRMTGKTPVRAQGQGQFPQPGWTAAHEWIGTVPFEEMPSTLNPPCGWVVSANHKAVPDDFPHFMGNIWMNGYRADRVGQLLASKAKWSRDDFSAIHMDVRSAPGLALQAHFRGLVVPAGPLAARQKATLDAFLSWDGQLSRETVGGTIYQVLRGTLVKLVVAAGTDDTAAFPWLVGKGMEPVLLKVSEFQGKDTEALLDMLDNPASQLVARAGGKPALLQAALAASSAWLHQELGTDPAQWRWGRIHRMIFPHALSIKPPLDRIFNLGPYPVPGDTDTVCQTAIMPAHPYEAHHVSPSYRQILDFADFGRSLWVCPPGQSGQLGSKHWGDQVDAWLHGRYFPMLWHRAQVEAATPAVTWLRPSHTSP
jgi:penicillin amidase